MASVSPSTSTAPLPSLPNYPPASNIPSSFAASFRDWWSVGEKSATISEMRLLSKLPFQTPKRLSSVESDSPVVAESKLIKLSSNPKQHINTLSMKATEPAADAPPPAVMLHGYGAGLGFYFQNFQTMAQWAGQRKSAVYALDWLGMGRSARPSFSISSKRENTKGRVTETEAFFIDSLEDWRNTMGLEKMTLIGHSIGGYLSIAYALKYPERVNRLVLLSPAGIPHGPDLTLPEREVQDEQVRGDDHAPSPATHADVEKLEADQKKAKMGMHRDSSNSKPTQSRTRRIFSYLWEEGYSPFAVTRAMTFWAPMVVGKYSSRRFSGLTEEETRNMHDYILNITLAKGSGEYCISHLLAPGAYARLPMVDRVHELKIPVSFTYGDSDWMDPKGGEESVENLRRAGNGQGRMYIVGNAGHHLYLDNPRAVNELLVKELNRDLRKSQNRMRRT
ncbi:Alpha/Beta hydrolase protein [Flagelloscypha sp. PMI_526]|nr:Alpha/Beta hydrolase protein [Flagelloscypha sp. PMI_526]